MDDLLRYLSIISVLAPLVTGLILFNYQESNARIALLLVTCASIPQLLNFSVFGITKQSMAVVYNAYTLIDVLICFFLFYRNIQKRNIRIIQIVLICVFLFTAIALYRKSGFNTFHNELVCFDSIIQMVWVLFFFYERYKDEKILRLQEQFIFWFCLGLLFYSPCTYFLFAFRKIVNDELAYLWGMHSVLNILMYVLITIGFFANYLKSKRIFHAQ